MRFPRGLNGLCVFAPTAALLLLAGCGGGGGGGGSPPPSPPPGPPAPAPQTIAFSNPGPVAVTYGDGSFTNAAAGGAGTGAISYASGTPAVATVEAATGVVTILAAGSSTISATKAADSTHLAATASYTLNVAKATQTIGFGQAGPVTKNFGDASFANTASGGSGTGAIAYSSANTAIATVEPTSGSVIILNAGSTQITATKAADANYLAAQASFMLIVSAVPQAISFAQPGPFSKTYGDPPFTNIASGIGGIGAITYSSNQTAVVSVDAASGQVTIVGAGTATITATRAADTNHLAAQASYSLSVARATQTIAFALPGPVNKIYTDGVFTNAASGGAGTGAITYTSTNPAVATVDAGSGAVTIVGVGTSVIGATKAASTNHGAAVATYSLNVAKAPQAIAFAQTGTVEKHSIDPPFTNTASGGTGTGAITYSSDNTAVATVNATTGAVSLVAAGNAHIVADKATDAHYLAAQSNYSLSVFQSGSTLEYTAWPGESDTEVQFPAAASGDEFLRANFPTCASPALSACATATSTLLGKAPVTDTVSQYPLWTQYWLRRAGVSYSAVQVSRSHFPSQRNPQLVEYDNQLWMVGAAPAATTWSSYDGRSWVMRSTADAYGPRMGHRAAAFNNKLWVVGGYKTGSSPGETSDVWSSPDGLNWTQVTAAAGFSPRDSHGLVAFNGKLWVVGGQQWDGYVTTASYNDVWSSPDGVTWTRATAAAGFSVRKPQLVVFNNKLWVVGGSEGNASRNDAWSSSDGVTWSPQGGVLYGTAEGLRATVLGSRIYVTGADFSDYYRQRVAYSDNGNAWTGMLNTVEVPFGRRNESAFFSFRNRIWLIGGDTPIQQICCTRADTWSSADGTSWTYEHVSAPYSPGQGTQGQGLAQNLVEFANRLWLLGPGGDGKTNAWSTTDGNDWVKSAGASVLPMRQWPGTAVFDGKLWMVGGLEADSGNPAARNDVWSSTDGNTWTQVTTNAAFSARYGHSLFVLNGKLYLVGGIESAPYERKSDVWSTLDGVTWTRELDNAPFGPRASHQTASLNGRIWLVGGFDAVNQMPGDVWSTTDGINWRLDVPSDPRLQRYEHRMTAFSGKLWVTGGRGTTYVETRDVISSADGIHWTAESTPAWSARTSHAAAVFGDHLFLFGGLGATRDEPRENEMWRTDDGVHWRLRHHNAIRVP